MQERVEALKEFIMFYRRMDERTSGREDVKVPMTYVIIMMALRLFCDFGLSNSVYGNLSSGYPFSESHQRITIAKRQCVQYF